MRTKVEEKVMTASVVSVSGRDTDGRASWLTGALETATDEALVDRGHAGDGDALAELYRRYLPPILRIARRYGPPAQAEDIAHEVFERLLTNLHELEEPAKAGHWLMRVARNRAIDGCRAASYQRETSVSAPPASGPTADGTVESVVEDRLAVRAIFGAIRPIETDLLTDHYLDDLSLAEVAQRHDSTEGSIKVRLNRSRRSARQFAEGSGWRGLVPWPLQRWIQAITSGSERWSAGAMASLVAGAVLGLGSITAGSATVVESPNSTTSSAREASKEEPHPGTANDVRGHAGGTSDAPRVLGRVALTEPATVVAREDRHQLVPADPAPVPLTKRQLNSRLEGPPDYEVGVRDPKTGNSVWVAIEDEPHADPAAETTCRVAEQPSSPTYCERGTGGSSTEPGVVPPS
jgi:RNA polymerase sigma-70 factor (ECF subfamily)